jgi:hypothetical protein
MSEQIGTSSPNQTSQNNPLDLGAIDLPILTTEEQKKIQENSEGIRIFVRDHLKKICDARSAPKIVDPKLRMQMAKGIGDIWKRINGFLDHAEAAYRLAAWSALIMFYFKTADPKDAGEANAFLDWMIEKKYLIEAGPQDQRVPLRAWKRGFMVPEKACFDKGDFKRAQDELEKLVTKTMKKTVSRRKDRAKEFSRNFPLDASRMFAGEEKGTVFFRVPPLITLQGNGDIKLSAGGFLLAEFDEDKDGKFITPLEGVGSFENIIEDAVNDDISIRLSRLGVDFPPSISKLINNGLSEDKANRYRICWRLLKRAKESLIAREQNPEEMVFLKEATISEKEFFLDQKEGRTLVKFEGIFETWGAKDGKNCKLESIQNLFFLIKRKGEKV